MVDKDYYLWCQNEALAIGSDGCSRVPDFRVCCCYEHDLGYYYGRDPRHAYKLGGPDPWGLAAKISRSEVDARFRECNQALSPLGNESPDSWIRFLGVRLGGWWAWRNHRKVRP